MGSPLVFVLFLQLVVAELGVLALQGVGRGVAVERVFQQVENQPEQCCLSCSVVAYESEYISIVDSKVVNVNGSFFAKILFQVVYFQHNVCK